MEVKLRRRKGRIREEEAEAFIWEKKSLIHCSLIDSSITKCRIYTLPNAQLQTGHPTY
ncbi:hypothetical protein LINPERPRIM_LOCUS23394 [Linum perenne]